MWSLRGGPGDVGYVFRRSDIDSKASDESKWIWRASSLGRRSDWLDWLVDRLSNRT